MFGVVVGSEPGGRVNPRGQLGMGGPSVVFEPTARDLDRLVEGMTLLGRAMLAGGAREVLPSTRSYRGYDRPIARYRTEADLVHLERLVKVDRDVVLGTAHPQGGNAVSAGAVATAATAVWSTRSSASTATRTCTSATRASFPAR